MQLSYVGLEDLRRLRTPTSPAGILAFADACRLNTLYMIRRAGSGHIGSSFSAMDVVAWLYTTVLSPNDIYFSSKGHDVPGLYAVLIALERLPFERIHQLRRRGGLPGHPDVRTPGIAANTGSLGMGLSKARGMLAASLGADVRAFVLTGDGELQEGQFWESVLSAGNRPDPRLRVIVDRNRIQSDTWVRSVSDLGDLRRKFESFGWAVAGADGHDPASLEAALRGLEGRGPAAIIADTRKGRGVSFMEEFPENGKFYGFHSGAPGDEDYARGVSELATALSARVKALGLPDVRLVAAEPEEPKQRAPRPQRLVAAYTRGLLAAAECEERVIALDADLVKDTGLSEFAERHPGRFVECGIAEQDMVSQAGGMALRGRIPEVHSFACFLSSRPNEQVYTNSTEGTEVVYVGSLAGLLPSGPGHSHQCVRDIAALSAVPRLVLAEPCCEEEAERLTRWAILESPDSVYLRLVSLPVDIPFAPPSAAAFGRGSVLREGADIVMVGAGPILMAQAWQAADLLARDGLKAAVINLPWLNRVDADWLKGQVAGARLLVTLDNHYLTGGQGEQLAAALAGAGWPAGLALLPIGIDRVPECGRNEEILAAHGLDAASLAERVRRSAR